MIRIFIAYSSKDLVFKEEIRKRLRPLQRAGKVDIWDNYDIEAGKNWDSEVKEKLANSDLILLLLSPDALDSEYFYEVEAPIALARHQEGDAIAVGVLLRPCSFRHTPFEFGKYELVPKKGYPITDSRWHNADEAYLTIFEAVDLLVEKLESWRNGGNSEVQRLEKEEAEKVERNEAERQTFEKKRLEKETLFAKAAAINIDQGAKEQKKQEGAELKKAAEEEQSQQEKEQTPIDTLHGKMLKSGGKEADEIIKRLGLDSVDLFAGFFHGKNKAGAAAAQHEDKIIGIDFGGTNIRVALSGKVLPNDEGAKATPSFVGFLDNGGIKIGAPAKRQMLFNFKRSISSVKRNLNLGRDFTVDGKQYTPEDICAILFKKVREFAEDAAGESIRRAVFAIPVYFSPAQLEMIQSAAKTAGFEAVVMMNEASAAALAYGLHHKRDSLIAVCDYGGSEFNFSVLEAREGVFETKYWESVKNSGGEAFDNLIVDWLAEDFKKQENVDLRKDTLAHQRLREAAEKAKIELSTFADTEINLPYITAVDGIPKHLLAKLKRTQFEQMIKPQLENAMEICYRALRQSSDLTRLTINYVVLCGGSSCIPMIQKKMRDFFGPKIVSNQIPPDEAVVIGAAFLGDLLTRRRGYAAHVLSHSIGIETYGGVFDVVIARNTPLPTSVIKTYSTASDNQLQVEIHVLQGEDPESKNNTSLGRFILDGILPAPRAVPQIEVTFEVDVNGVFSISAIDKGTGKKQNIRIESSTMS